MQEPLSESLDGTLNPRAFDYINADTDHAHRVISADWPGVVGQALRPPVPRPQPQRSPYKCWRNLSCSFGIIRHRGEHFFNGIFQANPHRPRYDCMTDVQFGQTRNLLNERDVLVIDAVTGINLHMGF